MAKTTIKYKKGFMVVAQELNKETIQKADSRALSLEKGFQNKLKDGFLIFNKKPIDTGKSFTSSFARYTANKTGFNILTKVPTEYASFFVRGEGSSRRYGRRDVFELIKKERWGIVKKSLNLK